jgi:hypothetical protein
MATARMAGTAPPPNCRRTSNTLAPILYFGNRPRRGSDASEPVEGRACHSSCGILQDMGGETSSVENSRPCAGFARRRFAGWEAQKQRIVLVRRALRCSAGRVMRRKHVTHPVMFDDLVGDPGHPSLLNAPPSPAVARDASCLISRAAPPPIRVSSESGRDGRLFCSGDAKGRAAHRKRAALRRTCL